MRWMHNSRTASCLAAFAATLLGMLLANPAQAGLVLIEVEGLARIDLAQRDSAGRLRLYDAGDDDGDGMFSFVADLDPQRSLALLYIFGGPSTGVPLCINFPCVGTEFTRLNRNPTPLTVTEERVITYWNSPPTMPFALGQTFSVVDGQIPGLDAIVYRSPDASVFDSADDIVDLDLTTLPLYTGPLLIGGLVRFQAVPEPSSFALAALGILGLIPLARRRRFSSKS